MAAQAARPKPFSPNSRPAPVRARIGNRSHDNGSDGPARTFITRLAKVRETSGWRWPGQENESSNSETRGLARQRVMSLIVTLTTLVFTRRSQRLSSR